MKSLRDYLHERPRRKTPAKVSESPLLSPDTVDALRRADTLVKKAQKTILEASYDIASSPERENSTRSPGNNEAEDDDELYIRDIVATRFYEANESARIFTRPSSRPLAERVCRPFTRHRRAKRFRQMFSHIRNERSNILQFPSVHCGTANLLNFLDSHSDDLREDSKENSLPRRMKTDEATPEQIAVKDTNEFRRSCKIDNRNVSNSFTVQEGARIDIRNELTITNVEKVDISPKPSSTFPAKRNTKTYEFRHEYNVCCKIDVNPESNEKSRTSGESETKKDFVVIPEAMEVAGSTSDSNRKRRGSVTSSQPTGSRFDLGENKFGRSVSAERLQGRRGDDKTRGSVEKRNESVSKVNDGIKDDNGDETNIFDDEEENREKGFIDFLRRFRNLGNDGEIEIPVGHEIFGNLGKRGEINNFNRAIERFIDELERDGSKESRKNHLLETNMHKNSTNDGAREIEDLIGNEFRSVDDLDESWNIEEINLQPPNIEELEKRLKKFGTSINDILRSTKNLDLLMPEYSVDAETTTPCVSTNQRCCNNSKSVESIAIKDFSSDVESKNAEKNNRGSINLDKIEARNPTRICDDSIESRGNSDESSIASRYRTDIKRNFVKPSTMEKESITIGFDHHPRFSTPLNNNDLKITKFRGSNADCKSNEFANFFNGIQKQKNFLVSNKASCSSRRSVFPTIDDRTNDNKIVTNPQNKFVRRRSVVTKNDLEYDKKMLLDEIEKKCNFQSLFDRQFSDRSEIVEKPRETETLSTIANEESFDVRNFETKSTIRDSEIRPATNRLEKKIFVAEKTIDEVGKKNFTVSERSERCEKNSAATTKCAIEKNDKNFHVEDVDGKNNESIETKSSIVIKNVVASTGMIDKSEKKSSATLQFEIVDGEKIIENDNENSFKSREKSNKTRSTASPGSSLKDRTSFDVSTVHSEDFHEPAIVDEISERHEKSVSVKSAASKSISHRVKIVEAKEKTVDCERDNSSKSVIALSLFSKASSDSGNESKEGNNYLKKSVSWSSVSKSSDKIHEDDKKSNSHEIISNELVTKENEMNDCNSEIKEKNSIAPKMAEETCKEGCKSASTSASSTRGCETRSVGETRRKGVTRPKRINDDEVLKNFDVAENFLLGKCDGDESAICTIGKPDVALDKSNLIRTISTDVNDANKDNEVVPKILNREIEVLKSNHCDKIVVRSAEKSCVKNVSPEKQERSSTFRNRRHDKELIQAGEKIKPERNKQSQDEKPRRELNQLEQQQQNINEQRKIVDESNENCAKSEEFVNFESSVGFHSTPKDVILSESSELHRTKNAENLQSNSKLQISLDDPKKNDEKKIPSIDNSTSKRPMENSDCASENSYLPTPDPISDDCLTAISDTFSDNYSEGELYLPSSCSYSLGEIRITERGSYGTHGPIIRSSAQNSDGTKIYRGKKNSTSNLSDEGIKGSNSLTRSPGEVQVTDIESICSSQGASSDGEHRMNKRYILQSKSIDT